MILSIFSLVSNGTLLLFTLRRWLFLVTVWRLGDWEIERLESRDWKQETSSPLPFATAPPSASLSGCPESTGETGLSSCLLLIPFRDEAANLCQLLPLLLLLEYPAECLTVVLVDDGSRDGSGRICQQFVSQYPNWHLLTLSHNMGKAAALNEALSHFTQGEFVAVFDADERPSPHTLNHLLSAFTNLPESASRVGAVNGRRAIHNPLVTPIASYATFENLVHQLITNRAKDNLQLATALLGSNCLYRREALTAVGNFTPGAYLEDSDLTVRLAKAGWRIRFVPTAISHHAVPETVCGYWQQHTRWHTGFQQVAQEQGTAALTQSHLPWLLRLELLLFSLGYLDRVALLIALAGWWQRPSRLTGLNISLNLLTPFIQIIYALHLYTQSDPHPKTTLFWQRLAYLPLFYVLDIAAILASTLQKVIRKPVQWETRTI